MKQIAIIGTTASGKTALALDIARKTNSIILSLDSLSIYKQIDIASAKPTKSERGDILHFGIDEVYPNENFCVIEFFECYKKAKEYAEQNLQNLIIVGGSSFYLKSLIDGLSQGEIKSDKLDIATNIAYEILYKLDPKYMQKIEKNDRYRIEKAYNIFKQTNLTPTTYFKQNKKEPLIKELPIFEIVWDIEILRKRVALRTNQMLKDGLIDEVIFLEKHYTREPNCMSSIGIVETLEYLDSKISKKELEEKISTNTAKLAKRQRTFNNSQFDNMQKRGDLKELYSEIIKIF